MRWDHKSERQKLQLSATSAGKIDRVQQCAKALDNRSPYDHDVDV